MPTGKKYDPNDVSVPVPDYNLYMQVLDLPHSLMGGTKAMRAKGTQYLPQEEAEKDPSYRNRLKRSFLLNAFRRTVQKLTGEVFSKAIDVPEKIEPEVIEWLENIDLKNNNVTAFSEDTFADGITDGVVHVLVDLPQINTTRGEDGKLYYTDVNKETGERVDRILTLESMKRNKWRPYFIEITAKNLIGWRFRKEEDGEKVLEQIRIAEVSEEPNGTYGVKEVHRIRVIEENSWEVFVMREEKGKKEWVSEKSGEHNRGFIPLESWFVGEQVGEMTAEPPMEDLAYLNLAHWQSSSDQRNILHFARLITYFGRFLDIKVKPESKTTAGEGAVFGANCLVHSNHESGDLKVVEHTGKAIESGRNDLKDLEAQMRVYGLGLVMGQKTGTVTATEKAIDTAESDSTLMYWAMSYGLFINRCVNTARKMMTMEPTNDLPLKVNNDFKSFLRSMEVRELREAYNDGLLPRELIFEEYQRRGIVKDDMDFSTVMAMLKKEQQEALEERRATFGLFGNQGSSEEDDSEEE